MAQEVFVARESGVAALNAVSNGSRLGKMGTREAKKAFFSAMREEGFKVENEGDGNPRQVFEAHFDEGGDYLAKGYHISLWAANEDNFLYGNFFYTYDRFKDDELEGGGMAGPIPFKSLSSAVKWAREKKKEMRTKFAPHEPRLYEIKLSNGLTLKKEGVDLENIQENFAQGWRELFGTYDGMPDFKTVKQHKLK